MSNEHIGGPRPMCVEGHRKNPDAGRSVRARGVLETPQTQGDVDLEQTRRLANARAGPRSSPAAADGVDVVPMLAAVLAFWLSKYLTAPRRAPSSRFWSCASKGPIVASRKRCQARAVVRLEQGRVDRQLVLADDLALHADPAAALPAPAGACRTALGSRPAATQPEDAEDVADDRAGDRGFDDVVEPSPASRRSR